MFGTITMNIPAQPGSYKIVLGHRPSGDDFSYPMSYFFGQQFTHLVVDDRPIGMLRDVQVEGDTVTGIWDYSRQDKHIVWELQKQGILEDSISIKLSSIQNRKTIYRPDQDPIRLVTINAGAIK